MWIRLTLVWRTAAVGVTQPRTPASAGETRNHVDCIGVAFLGIAGLLRVDVVVISR